MGRPICQVSSFAIASRWLAKTSQNAVRILARSAIGVCFQARCATRAWSSARSISAAVASSRSTYTLPSMGERVRCMVVVSDDLEITRQLPIRDVLAELALFPLAGRGEVLDERVAKIFARHLGLFQALCRFPQGARQGEVLGKLVVVGIAFDQRLGLDAILDAPQPRA